MQEPPPLLTRIDLHLNIGEVLADLRLQQNFQERLIVIKKTKTLQVGDLGSRGRTGFSKTQLFESVVVVVPLGKTFHPLSERWVVVGGPVWCRFAAPGRLWRHM